MNQHVYSDSLALSLSFADHDISGIGTLRVEVHVGNRHFSDKSTCNLVEHAVRTWGHMCPCVCSFLRRTRDKFMIIGLTQYIARSACCERSRFESSTARATYQFIVCYRHFADTCRRYGGG